MFLRAAPRNVFTFAGATLLAGLIAVPSGRRLMDSIQADLAVFTTIEERALALHELVGTRSPGTS